MLHPYSLGMVARRFALGMLGLTFAFSAQAQLATYSFGTTTPSVGNEATYPADAQPANATFSPISRGSGVTPSLGGGAFASTGWTTAATPDVNDYYTFSVTPASGATLNLTSVTLDERRSGTGITEWVMRSSLDNFASDLVKVTVPDDSDTRVGKKIDLPAAFTGLTSAVEFRFYGYKAEAEGGSWRLDNIKVDGSVTTGTTTAPTISFASSGATVDESAGVVRVPVKLSAASTQEIKVDVVVATPAGSATATDDYTYTKQTVTFPANSTAEQTVDVTIVNDNAEEALETIMFSLENALPAAAATVSPDHYTLSIAANDAVVALPVLTLDKSSVDAEEGQDVSIQVQLSAVPTTAVTVKVMASTTGGSASSSDYTFEDKTLTFAAGDNTAQTVTLKIVDDAAQEASETLQIMLMDATGATLGTPATLEVKILANDVPAALDVTPIATLTQNDANGVPLKATQRVKATGVVYGPNLRTAGGYQFALIDATGGIGIFSSANLGDLVLAQGDSVDVTGTLAQFNGLTQITATEITRFRQNAALVTPRVVTAVGEGEESELITVNGLTLVDPLKWPTEATTGAATNVEAKDAAGTIFQLRITKVSGLYAMSAPAGTFAVTGLGGQFDSNSPFDTGYQIFPRSMADIVLTPTANREPAFGRTVQLYPNPAAGQLNLKLGAAGRGATVEVLSLLGQRISRTTATSDVALLNVASLQRGTYLVRITTKDGSVTRRFVKQ
ncbi:T9SS type A sorting domain-containing protein [Hymenobacter lutimineralis]|uniref:T9SS type A sorting domain-containing protein n=1 Tax=Hymenobacter lutimineralis TaxID=2606448 RepID=A0A5D6V7M1_9BACT|nr:MULTISPECIES: Calx-beta domain-containing protein [Hymenobacter]QIX62564.1 T9SS type A sorting domain-containing protein [Hymenobacter sp. BT18]TYZ11873.1 T9SS type A sorting domain-containing protein [Hymenobacter lutimineralis]